MFQDRRAVIAISPGVGHDMHLDSGQRAVALGADLDVDLHRMAGGRGDELFLAGEFDFDRLAGFQRGQCRDVLDHHFLLGAEAAADALAQHPYLVRIEIEYAGEFQPGQERHLRAGAHIEPTGRRRARR